MDRVAIYVAVGHLLESDIEKARDTVQSQARARRRGDRRSAIDFGNDDDASRIVAIDIDATDAADIDAQIANRTAPLEAAHAAGEVDLVQLVVARIVRVRLPARLYCAAP